MLTETWQLMKRKQQQMQCSCQCADTVEYYSLTLTQFLSSVCECPTLKELKLFVQAENTWKVFFSPENPWIKYTVNLSFPFWCPNSFLDRTTLIKSLCWKLCARKSLKFLSLAIFFFFTSCQNQCLAYVSRRAFVRSG